MGNINLNNNVLQALAEPIRMMLAYTGVPWEDKRYQVQCVCVCVCPLFVRECVYTGVRWEDKRCQVTCVFF
jgi:hypothetical protein